MIGLTTRQSEALDAIRKLSRKGRPPSRRELGDELGIRSLGHVQALIAGLKERGAVEYEPNRSRTLRLTEADNILTRSTSELTWLRDQIERELRKRTW